MGSNEIEERQYSSAAYVHAARTIKQEPIFGSELLITVKASVAGGKSHGLVGLLASSSLEFVVLLHCAQPL